MKKVLYMLGEFADQDIDWLISAGQREYITEGTVLIKQGSPVEEIFFVLRGQLDVSIEDVGEIARIGSGEIVGELSLLDSRPPNATVTALEDSVVMAVAKQRVDGRLRTDAGFSGRFYRALGLLLADRLRDSVGHLAYQSQKGLSDQDDGREISPELLERMNLAAQRFQQIRERLLD
ncbi:MAG: cyclic nucleotide-binding protein [Acidiferrobacteraceae bacterium]|jgi:CRP-like cAMP-binding protein|nr:cyclic nucleotide-binding protein [Acidiferrobacteraceae bacterium]MDP6411810.1 cyclic nucleotide-binding domain-containing protein [Arenicellales bacterium]MDP6530740.1 cyclic nucleotide-binding domain-containing protein [Arenicellales bacterium]MDP6855013.1 cyclic nucleotide-binding domain-containing protein [Arenicellales bacterium]|tara:strand:+ start:471 stop:1001 length:531 start_codon:yes stop_codon:yes gene_type:complete